MPRPSDTEIGKVVGDLERLGDLEQGGRIASVVLAPKALLIDAAKLLSALVEERPAAPASARVAPSCPDLPERLRWDDSVSRDSPTVRGTWITVRDVAGRITGGEHWGDVLRDNPELSEDDLWACLVYALSLAD